MASSATAVAIDPKQYVADAIKKVTAIATLPEVTNKIIITVEDPKASASTLHKIVSHDPALVSRILKVVNSAFYGLPGQIGSIERAIVLLGLNAVKNIAVAASLGQMFRGALCDGFTAKDLWTHCMAVAITSRELAKQMKAPIADEAFLAGMIHDLGLLVSLQVNPEQLRAACEKAKGSGGANFCEIEREVIGVDHQQLGEALAAHWKFPRSCQLVAGHHHQPALLSDNNRLLVTLVYVADTICCQANRGFNLTALEQKLDDADLAGVQLDMSLVERTRTNLPNLLDGAASLMS
ncbi:MAG: HDOD domain-containing protein [Tepidisphaeraceae bacterium]